MRSLQKLGRAALLVWLSLLSSPAGRSELSGRPKHVLTLYWEDQNHPANIDLARSLRAALQSVAPGGIEYYSEFLEASRFPGEKQSKLLHDYMLQKYAGRPMDVVVATEGVALEFLLKYRSELFPRTPIVFASNYLPQEKDLKSGAGATGILYVTAYKQTIELALKLHPGTEHVFIVSSHPPAGNSWEASARRDLQDFRGAAITYLTDLPLEELRKRLRAVPDGSVVLYVWERLQMGDGKFLETRDVLASIAPSVRVPIYGLSFANVGRGIVGGFVWTMDSRTRKMADLILKVANGAKAGEIPVEKTPVVPMFDWRELQRWRIDENRLPPGSVVRFRTLTLWEQYHWHIATVGCVLLLQSVLIGALLMQRRRARRSAAALQESEARFRNMADTAPVLIWVSGPDKLCTFFNKAWLSFAGRGMEQEIGNEWLERVHSDDLDRWHETYSSSFDSRSAFQVEYRLRRADGEYRSLLCAGAPRFRDDGTFAGYVGSSLDITDLKRALERALAGQRLQSLGLLASGIAHDFNNLLGGILTSAELALTEHAEGAPLEEELLRIKAAALGGAQIVRELMIFGATENPSFEPVDCSQIVREMVQVLKVLISKSAILKPELADEPSIVHGNAAQIRQLIMNLVINASQAIGDGEGEIRITTRMLSQDQSTALAAEAGLPPGEYMKLEVADTGSGITDEIKGRIFDPFFSTKAAGRGLGLAVVQRIVRAHGGAIKVLSRPGNGTIFRVMFPCVRKCETAMQEHGTSNRRTGDPPFAATLLVIEDEAALRTSVSKILRRRGYSVIEAGDGNAGVDLFRNNATAVDVVLLDMTLPGKSGREVLTELQRIDPQVKVMVTSAYGQRQVQISLGGLEAWGYVQKPYRISELENLLQQCVSEKRGLGRAAAK